MIRCLIAIKTVYRMHSTVVIIYAGAVSTIGCSFFISWLSHLFMYADRWCIWWPEKNNKHISEAPQVRNFRGADGSRLCELVEVPTKW